MSPPAYFAALDAAAVKSAALFEKTRTTKPASVNRHAAVARRNDRETVTFGLDPLAARLDRCFRFRQQQHVLVRLVDPRQAAPFAASVTTTTKFAARVIQ